MVNLLSRDVRSSTGKNIRLVSEESRRNPWEDTVGRIRAGLMEAEGVHVDERDKWRVGYLGVLLEKRQAWHYKGAEAQEEEVQELVDSLCVN